MDERNPTWKEQIAVAIILVTIMLLCKVGCACITYGDWRCGVPGARCTKVVQ